MAHQGDLCDHAGVFRVFWLFLISFFATLWRRMRRGPLRPTWPFRFEMVVAFFRRDWRGMRNWADARVRAHLERLPVPGEMIRRTRRETLSLGDVPGVGFTPDERARRDGDGDDDGDGAERVILYLHGGSFLYGSTRTHADIMARLAVQSGIRVVGIDYRLAPRHPYPAALDDADAAFQALIEGGIPAGNILLAGDSAGGNLCIVLMVRLREAGRDMPAGAILISPWVDLECKRPSMERNQAYDYGTAESLRGMAARFAGDMPLSDARISPIHARFDGLPPWLLQYGGAELLEDECRDLGDRARAAGVDVTVDVLVDMPHNGPIFAALSPVGARAIERAATFARRRLGVDGDDGV